ncbi:glycosyl transferase [bacterium]|nr:MAG: glycosyl transferase [bacterium]RKZ17999.1 MAG: glycosyl transferase [bacterium]
MITPHAGDPALQPQQRIAVLLPCFNEEVTVATVVTDFRAALPSATVYVFDNNSTDRTAALAEEAGAVVVPSPRQGKGHVIAHMFRSVDADIYIMADGDDTYPADRAVELIEALESSGADMVVGARLTSFEKGSFRLLHGIGNRVISGLISLLFATKVSDVLSGYRVFSRDFVQRLYLRSPGFEIETEMTLQAIVKDAVIREVPIHYGKRPEGSRSKLNTFSDGWQVLRSIFLIFKDYQPLAFFTVASALCFVLGLVAGWYPIADYVQTRYVSHVPLALLAAALEILAVLFLGIGLILNAITKFHIENQEVVASLHRRLDRSRD